MKRWRPLETAVLMTLRRLGLEARLVNVHESSEPPPAPSLEILDPDWGIAAFVDTETTGLDYHHDEVIELAIVLFAFDRNTGSIIGVLDEHVGLRDPSCEISRGATAVNGIEWKMVQGHCLDKPRIETLFEKAEFLISHNAPFDLNFVHHIFPAIQLKPWLCSMNGIDWYGKGFQSRGLQELLGCHGIRPLKAHRGLDDCKSAIALLALRSPSGRTYLAELLEGREASKLQRTILDDHAAYGDMIRHYYEARESDPTAFEAAIRACTMQISTRPQEAATRTSRSGLVGLRFLVIRVSTV